MFKGGYMGNVLRVNLTKKTATVEKLNEREAEMLLGGRGLAAKRYYDEIDPAVRPFDPENKVFFFTGPLTGVRLPSTTKFQLSTKSPETGMYLCSNCGGDFGPQLKMAGYDGLVIEGKAADWTYLIIRGDGSPGTGGSPGTRGSLAPGVTFGDARPWRGMMTDKTLIALREAIGDTRAGAMAIGPAGERLVKLSCIQVDSRAFGRGGAGAVLGSKMLKGIAVRGTGRIPVADGARIDEIRKAAIQNLKETRANHTKYGTPQYIATINELGCMPTRNFQTTWFEGTGKIDAHAMYERYLEKNTACYMCPVACGKMNAVKEGPYAGARARTEFETIGLLGPNCGVEDFGAIVKGNQLCDEYGIDTMSGGHAVALTMELYEKGLITKQDTEGIDARFGNPDALIGLIRLVGERKGIGDLLAEGMAGVARKKPAWSRYILACKGLPFAAYDPRGFYGNALTYGTSNRGACHNVGGWTIRAELQSGKYDRWATKGKGELVMNLQDNRAYVDSIGVCTVVRGSMDFSDSPKMEVTEAVTGHGFTPKLMAIGSRIYTFERIILNREGIRRKDDAMPERILTEAVPSGPIKGKTLTSDQYEAMLDEYYDDRGWDREGVPSKATIEKLDLAEFLS